MPNKALQLTAARRSVEMVFRRYPFRHTSCCRFAPEQEVRRHYLQLAAERGLPGSGS